MTAIRNSIFSGLAFGILLGLFLAALFEPLYALAVGLFSGFVFGTMMYFFLTSKSVKKQTQIENLNGQTVVRSGGANHFIKAEAVGGKLYLLEDRLHFKSHHFNTQNHELIINLLQIKEVSFYNTLGFFPNGLAVTTNDGQTEKFVVNNRKLWKEEIEKALNFQKRH